jgi:hypothetical protein
MHIHRVLCQPGRLRNFGNIEILYKPENEHRALPFRQSFRRFPDRSHLFVDRRPFFRRAASIGPIMNPFVIDAFHLFPELKPSAARMIADEID